MLLLRYQVYYLIHHQYLLTQTFIKVVCFILQLALALAKELLAASEREKAEHEIAVREERERRLKEAAQRENERLQQEEATAAWADGGVALRARLWAVRSDAAQARGIRRHADRAQLPARLGAALQAERLAGSAGGASTWEVRLGGRSAHVAALDFAAEAETVGPLR
mgnify:CR=1 FL=1